MGNGNESPIDKKKKRGNVLKTLLFFSVLIAVVTLVKPFYRTASRSTATVEETYWVNGKFGMYHFAQEGKGSFTPSTQGTESFTFTWKEKNGYVETARDDLKTDFCRYDSDKILDVDNSILYIAVVGGKE